MSKLEDKLLRSIERGNRSIEKLQKNLQKMMDDNRRRTINNLMGVDMDCPKCGAFIDERDNGCLVCDFFDRLAAQDKIRE